MPETFGNITSSSTRSGWTASNRSSASAPSRATWTRKPSRVEADGERVDEGVLVLDDEDGGGGMRPSAGSCSDDVRHGRAVAVAGMRSVATVADRPGAGG